MVQNETHRTNYEIDLILHDNPNISSEDLAPYVAERAGVDLGELEVLPDAIRLTVAQDRLDDLAALDSVNRIEEVRPKKLYNDQARGILHADVLFNSTGYQGAGQVICLADTGFDQGLMVDKGDSKVHPAFGGRVERLVSLWPKYGAKDPVGHGTHVSGSACGDGIYTSSEGKKISMKGTAPAAKLMMQSMSMYDDQEKKWVLGLPAGVSKLFSVPYDFGYRIHSNSWGSVWDPNIGQLGYDREATATDRFINKYQDFIILIAAGNDADEVNHGDSQIGGNSAAKNCITVGATGTTRPNDGYTYKIKKPANSSGPTNTAVFSSRGPTKATQNSQGQIVPSRIKPDVAAPGVAVLSAASRSVAMDDKVRIEGGPSNDKDWIFMSGTSMATPLVAGCVALVREALQKQGKQKPSAALVKALLVNGAVNFSSTNGLGFDYEQGFGRVDIDSSINTVKKLTFIDGGNKLEATNNDVPALRFNSDVAKRWESPTISVPGGHNKLITTLVYPDRSGELTQNDVNLIVRAGGSERHGNMGTGTGFDHISEFI